MLVSNGSLIAPYRDTCVNAVSFSSATTLSSGSVLIASSMLSGSYSATIAVAVDCLKLENES